MISLLITYLLVFCTLPIIVGIWYFFFREKIGYTIPNPLIAKYLKNSPIIRGIWILRIIFVFTLCGIIAGVEIQYTHTTESTPSQDVMIVFDGSLSMLAEDVHPNRITAAKSVIKNFIQSQKNTRFGLILFAGKPFQLVSFSHDTLGIKHIIDGLSPYLIKQDISGLAGTNIGDAILLANMAFSGSQDNASIILLTDGKANIGLDPPLAAEESHEKNIKIYPIGIGSLSGTELFYTDSSGKKTYFYDEHGHVIKSDLDEPMMQRLADKTGGKYFHGDRASDLVSIFESLRATLQKHGEPTVSKDIYNLLFPLIILSALLILGERYLIQSIQKKYHLTNNTSS